MDEGKRHKILEQAQKDEEEQKQAAIALSIQQAKETALKRKLKRFENDTNNQASVEEI